MRRPLHLVPLTLMACAMAACAPAPQASTPPGTPAGETSPAGSAAPSPSTIPSVATDPSPTTTTSASTPVASCVDVGADLSLEEAVGQLYMVGVSTSGLDEATAEAISSNLVGSVVLLGNSTAGADAISQVTRDVAALSPDGLPILVAVDQEGGTVQRLQGPGFSAIPPATEQARLAPEELREAARGWGDELADVGVHMNLAPVADVVPPEKQESNAPIGALRRNYGTDVTATAESVAAFVAGMSDAGVATSLKHFPGLGQVTANTDFDVAVDDAVVPGDADWASFVAGIDAGASSVMVSSAIFTRLDPDNEGVFSSTVVTDILREQLGYDRVAIADDLGAAAAVADVPPAERGVRFIEAGGDLVINADPAIMGPMVQATLDRASEDPAFTQRVRESAARVLALKASAGLLGCDNGAQDD